MGGGPARKTGTGRYSFDLRETMGKSRIFLDYNATTPLRPEARNAVLRALGMTGNASSVHAEGRAARALVEQARREVAAFAGAAGATVIFTSGGTEANNLALGPGLHRAGEVARGLHLFVSAIEHPSVLQGHRFPAGSVTLVPARPDGTVDIAALGAMLAALPDGVVPLVALMLANNETGVIQPVREVAGLVHAFGGFVQCDAVQAAGRISLDFHELGVDLMTLSAHKIGGPQGVGALIAAAGIEVGPPLVRGGGQQDGRRAGTENLPGIAGFAAAARAAADGLADMARLAALRDRAEAGILRAAPDAAIIGRESPRLANTLCFAVPGVEAETLVIAFDLAGIAVSSGSACSSGKVGPSHVLQAMGLDGGSARGAVRVSLGRETDETEIGNFIAAWAQISSRVHASAA